MTRIALEDLDVGGYGIARGKVIVRVEPPDAVVSEVRPSERVGNVGADICAVGHLFSSREMAAGWLAQYPQGLLNSVAEDFDIHRQMMVELGWAPG